MNTFKIFLGGKRKKEEKKMESNKTCTVFENNVCTFFKWVVKARYTSD